MLLLIILIITVLLASAVCSMTEAAILSISLIRVRILEEEKRHGAKDLLFIKDNIHRAVATIVILNNAVNIIGAVFVGQMVAGIFGNEFLGICSAVLTFAIIIISEVIPKTIGEHYKVRISLGSARILRATMWVFTPLVTVISLLMRPFTKKGTRSWVTEKEIKMLLRLARAAGTVELDEETLINRVFKLNDLTALQMMKPIRNMYALDGGKKLIEAKEGIMQSPYSRIAIFEKDPANIIGVAQQRVLLREMANDNENVLIKDFVSTPVFVNEEEKADSLLDKFQSYHQHFFIVRDLKGKNIGIISMEDVLEELFGEIYDEKDASRLKRSSE